MVVVFVNRHSVNYGHQIEIKQQLILIPNTRHHDAQLFHALCRLLYWDWR